MEQLTGQEKFTSEGIETDISVFEFWQWAYSDLLNNTYRGVLAEFLVQKSLGVATPPVSQMRIDWMPFDLSSPSGRRIEVKSAAYLQSWTTDFYSKILFDIAPKHSWQPEQGYSADAIRPSDLYVFCVYTALSKDQSILDLDLWDFYVLPTSILDAELPKQKKISLGSLSKLKPTKCDFFSLGNVIETIPLSREED